jgi:hypothetical protein
MTDEVSASDERYALVEARMANAMRNVRKWLFVTLCCWGFVAILTIVTAFVLMFMEGRPASYDSNAVVEFASIMSKIVGFIYISVYAAGALAIGYFVQYMRLDSLLKKHQVVTE